MPTRKIRDLPEDKQCKHPDHNPAMYIKRDPGVYEHVCPGCGKKTEFTVNHPWKMKSKRIEPMAVD